MNTDKKLIIDEISNEIFNTGFPIADERKQQIKDFIATVINGDNVKKYLTFAASLSKDKAGILVYILTNNRLVKLEIDDKTIESNSPFLNEIVSIERKLLEGNIVQIAINIPNSSIGLRYPSNIENITSFFQEVEQSRKTS